MTSIPSLDSCHWLSRYLHYLVDWINIGFIKQKKIIPHNVLADAALMPCLGVYA